MSKSENGGLDQYGAEPFEQQQFGIEGVKGIQLSSAGQPGVIAGQFLTAVVDNLTQWTTRQSDVGLVEDLQKLSRDNWPQDTTDDFVLVKILWRGLRSDLDCP